MSFMSDMITGINLGINGNSLIHIISTLIWSPDDKWQASLYLNLAKTFFLLSQPAGKFYF